MVGDVHITENQIDALEKVTLSQLDTMLSHEQRVGNITASKAHQVLHTNAENPVKSLLREICFPSFHKLQVPAIMWGNNHEKEAFGTYQKIVCGLHDENILLPLGRIILSSKFQKNHNNPKISRAGLRISAKEPWIGVSPDGYVNCDCCGKGVFEIKCPLNLSNEGTSFETYVSDNRVHLDQDGNINANHKYYAQMQLQMNVCKADNCHFVT